VTERDDEPVRDDEGRGAPIHVPVMLEEVLELLDPRPGEVFADATIGAGGHAREIARRLAPAGRLIGIDRDPEILALSGPISDLVTMRHANFADLDDVFDELGVEAVDGVLLDLGVSSYQLSRPERGMSFDSDAPLDLRMDPTQGEPAWQLIRRLGEKELADVFYRYGEERRSRGIAKAVKAAVGGKERITAREFADVVARRARSKRGGRSRIHPATRCFQALRIFTNGELEALEAVLPRALARLAPGGRIAVVSFHSLEDRIVKEFFRTMGRAGAGELEVLTKKPVRPTEAEVERNPRSRSGRLRAARKPLGRDDRQAARK